MPEQIRIRHVNFLTNLAKAFAVRRRRNKSRSRAVEALEQRSLLVAPVEFEWGQAVPAPSWNKVDTAGNLYAVGSYSGTVDFDPGVGVVSLTSVGATDVFITKTDTAGNLVWARSIGGSLADTATGLGVEAQGSVILNGTYSGTIDLDPGSGTSQHTSAGLSDVFILKLDENGQRLWSGSIGGTAADTGLKMDLLYNGNVILGANSGGSMDFDPGPAVFTQASSGTYGVSLTSEGQFLEVRSGLSGLVDSFGYRYSTNVDTSLPLVGGNLQILGARGRVTKRDMAGNTIWARTFNVLPTERGYLGGTVASGDFDSDDIQIALDPSGGLAIGFRFWGDLEVDPSRPIIRNNKTREDGVTRLFDAAVMQLSEDGNLKALSHFDSNGSMSVNFPESVNGNTLHMTARIQVAGSSDSGTGVDLDPGTGVYSASGGIFDLQFNGQGQVENISLIPDVNSPTLGSRLYDDGNNTAYFLASSSVTGVVDADPGLGVSLVTVNSGMRLLYKMNSVMNVSVPAGQQGDLLLRRNGDWAEVRFKSSTSTSYQLLDRNLVKDLQGIRLSSSSVGNSVTVDFAAGGSFSMPGGIDIVGATGTDSIRLIGRGNEGFTYSPAANGSGTVNAYGQDIKFSGIEALRAENLQHLFVTPLGSTDVINVAEGASVGNEITGGVTGTTDGVAIVPMTFVSVRDLTIDTGRYDAALLQSNDSVTFDNGGLDAAGLRNIFVRTGKGDDTLSLISTNPSLADGEGSFWFIAGAGIDSITAVGDANWDLNDSRLISSTSAKVLLTGIEKASITGGSSRNNLNARLFTGDMQLDGAGGDDLLRGGPGDDTIYGGIGNDRILGGDGNDYLSGQDGNDQMWGEAGDDFIYGGAGNDYLLGGDDTDWIFGDVGNDQLFGNAGADVLNGGTGNDLLDGGTDDDRLIGSTGIDLFVLAGTNAPEELQLIRPTSTSAIFRRKPKGLLSVLELDTITIDAQDEFYIQAYGGDDLLSIDLAFQQLGSVDGGDGLDVFTGPLSWIKSNL